MVQSENMYTMAGKALEINMSGNVGKWKNETHRIVIV